MAAKKKAATRGYTRRAKKRPSSAPEEGASLNSDISSQTVPREALRHEFDEDYNETGNIQGNDNEAESHEHMATEPNDTGAGNTGAGGGTVGEEGGGAQSEGEEQRTHPNAQINTGSGNIDYDGGDVWTAAREDELLDLYRAAPHLWDKSAPGYKTRNKREIAICEWSKKLKIEGMYML